MVQHRVNNLTNPNAEKYIYNYPKNMVLMMEIILPSSQCMSLTTLN